MSNEKWFKIECRLSQSMPDLDEVLWQWMAEYDCLGAEIGTDNASLNLFFGSETTAIAVAQRLPQWLRCAGCCIAEDIRVREVTRTNWNEAWKQYFVPTRIGKRFLVLPPWETPSDKDLSEGRRWLYIEPGMAFGTGTHATTQLCLRFLETIDLAQRSVLDVGTGSGILAIAAAKSGARWCVGIDHDKEIIENAARNLTLNNIFNGEVTIVVCRVDDLRTTAVFDIVLCNMLYHEAEPLFPAIKNHLRPDGLLCLSGFLCDEEHKVKHELNKLGFRWIASDKEEEWAAGLFMRS